MTKRSLRTHLKALRRELADADTLDRDMRAELAAVADQIDVALAAREPDYGALQARLETTAFKFEAEHPRFAGILSDIMDVLSKLGI